tara:strand:+ start:285 stop:527 length:243 start_codon:yes stop_codon:yes gene_type:complete
MKIMWEILQFISVIAFVSSLVAMAIYFYPTEKNYHCHAKTKFLYESILDGSNVFVKTDRPCIDIRDIEPRQTMEKQNEKN